MIELKGGKESDSAITANTIQVSIIVVVKNGEKWIRSCLDSLLAQNETGFAYEIIVVDGGSSDRTLANIEGYKVKLIIDKEGTIAHSRNIGIQASLGEYVAFTDSDCIVQKDWLKLLFEDLKNRPEVIAVGGPNLVRCDDPPFSKVIAYMQGTYFGSGGSPQSYNLKESKYVYSLANCNVMYRKNFLVGNDFDDRLNVGEDCELNYRLYQKGYHFLYLPNAVVWHARSRSFQNFTKKMFLYGDAMAKVIKKHKCIVRWFAPLPTIGLLSVIFSLLLTSVLPAMFFVDVTLLLFYFVVLLSSTAEVYSKYRSKASLLVLLLLPAQHLAYASGFLKGIL